MDVDSLEADWPCNHDAMHCHRFMLERKLAFDVWFKVGPPANSRRIGAHKYMLSARSYTFYLMFNGPNPEGDQGDIQVQDTSPECFEELLCYIYCDEVNFNQHITNICNLRKAGEKYNIQGLVTRCKDHMKANLNVDNLCAVLENTLVCNDGEMRKICQQTLRYNTPQILESHAFLNVSRVCVEEILSYNDLNLAEETIYERVLMWAIEECGRRNLNPEDDQSLRRVLTWNVLKQIRFSHMQQAYFTDRISHRGILKGEEKLTIYRFFGTNRATPPLGPRNRRIVFDRFKSIRTGKGYFRGNEDTLDLVISKNISLHEILIYGSCQDPGRYNITVKIKDESALLCQMQTQLDTDGKIKVYPIKLDDPVLMIQGTKYTVSMLAEGPPSYFGEEGMTPLTSNGVTVNFSLNPTGLNGTSIEDGQFAGFVFKELEV